MDLAAIGTALIGQDAIRARAKADGTWPVDGPDTDSGGSATNAEAERSVRRSRRHELVISVRRVAAAALYTAADHVAVPGEECA